MRKTLLANAFLLVPASVHAVTTIYTADIDGATTGGRPTGFNAIQNGGSGASSSIQEITAEDKVFTQRATATSTGAAGVTAGTSNTAASVTFSDIGGAGNRTNFSVTTTFRIDELSGNGGNSTFNISLNALSGSTDLSSGYRLIYTLFSTGNTTSVNANSASLVIQELGTTGGLSAGSGSGLSTAGTVVRAGNLSNAEGVGKLTVTPDTLYTMSLTGTYNGDGSLSLTGVLSQGATSLTVNANDTTLQTGTNFGIRTALSVTGESSTGVNRSGLLETDFESFVVIPEPSSMALLGLAIGCLGLRRSRK